MMCGKINSTGICYDMGFLCVWSSWDHPSCQQRPWLRTAPAEWIATDHQAALWYLLDIRLGQSFLMFLIKHFCKHFEAQDIYPAKFLTRNLFAFHLYGFEFLNFIMSFRGLLSPTFTYLFTYIGQNSKIFLAMCFLFSAEATPMWLVKFLNLCSLWTGLDWFVLYNRSLSKLSFLCFPQYKYCVQLSPT